MNRKEKIEALQQAFTGNLNALKGADKMTIEAVVVLRGGWYQIVPIEPSFEIPEKELTFEAFQNWKGCIPLFPDLNNFKKLDLSKWTNEQLEARLFELENKLIDHEK